MIKEEPEKRRGPRIHTELPVLLKNAKGITRDVSASGVYFWTSAIAFAPGEVINFAVELKRKAGTMRLRCQGDVVRMDRNAAEVGVAVKIVESAMELT